MEILFATDDSPGAEIALGLLEDLPISHHDRVTALCVATASDRMSQARQIADAATERLVAAGIAARAGIGRPPVVEAIIERLLWTPADLVVVGSRGLGVVGGALLGSVSSGLAERVPTPLLVVRESARALARVLVATDGSAAARTALGLIDRLPLPASAHFSELTFSHDRHTADRIVQAASEQEADLLVIAFDASAWTHAPLLPGLAASILARAHCSVLLATPASGTARS